MRSEKFWDKIAARYAKRPVADEEAYQQKLRVTREYLRPDMQVLEFGCGTGSTAIAHAPYVQHIRAIDVSANMIAIAQDKARADGIENVTFEKLTIEELDVPDASFDAVLGLSILHLLEDKEAVIARVHRILKPGGIFVSSTACIGDSMKYFRIIAPVLSFVGLPSVSVFKVEELEQILTAAGFTIDHQWQPGRGAAVFIVAVNAQKATPG
ncbi:MAG: class I SAM-dependent methyltransferase [Gammaproteobacteria bacterium]